MSSGSTHPEVTALVGVSLLFPAPEEEGFPGPMWFFPCVSDKQAEAVFQTRCYKGNLACKSSTLVSQA